MTRTLHLALCAVFVVSVFATARPAFADGGTAWSVVDISPGEPTDKDKNPAPRVKVKIVGETAPKPDESGKWVLKQVDSKLKGVTPLTGTDGIIPYHKSNETLAIVVVVEGHEYYFGNDQYVEEPAKEGEGPVDPNKAKEETTPREVGVYATIVTALDAAAGNPDDIPRTISQAGPDGSKGALIVYSVGADVRKGMGPLKELTGEKLGTQDLQSTKRRRDFAEGLRVAQGLLKNVSASRKVMFIISDGYESGGTEVITSIKKGLNADNIDVYAFLLESKTIFIGQNDKDTQKKNSNNMDILGAGANSDKVLAKDAKDLSDKIGDVVANKINNRFWLIFPGGVIDPKTKLKSGFTWDEQEHQLTLLKEDEPVGENEAKQIQNQVLAPKWGGTKGKSMWWLWIAIPGGILLLGVLIMALGGKKQPAPPPMPMPMPVPMPVAGPPPPIQAAPAQSNKTMAINISSGDGVPVVGWLVPINGPQAFQTFKMVAGVTKVGNTQGAHIVINDGFMSGDHAHIAMSPNGFTLIDNNSTNGTFVNERRVQRHDLIDNDVIKFGKTDCKFKTILG